MTMLIFLWQKIKELIKMENFCFLKDTVKRKKRQRRLAASVGKHVSDKGLEHSTAKILNTQRQGNHPVKKTGKRSEQTFHHGRYTDVK